MDYVGVALRRIAFCARFNRALIIGLFVTECGKLIGRWNLHSGTLNFGFEIVFSVSCRLVVFGSMAGGAAAVLCLQLRGFAVVDPGQLNTVY